MAGKRKPAPKTRAKTKAKRPLRQKPARRAPRRGKSSLDGLTPTPRRGGGRKARKPLRDRIWWRVVRGTSKGTVRGIRVGTPMVISATKKAHARYKEGRTFESAFGADYVPEQGEIPPRKFARGASYVCCGRRFKSVEWLNQHHEEAHGGENPEVAKKAKPKLYISKTAKTLGKVTVVPTGDKPTGRHRPSKATPAKTRVDALIAAHRDAMDKIGEKAVMDDDSAARFIHRGFQQLEGEKVGTISQIQATLLGLERAVGGGAEAISAYRQKLIQKGFDPAHVQNLSRMADELEAAARRGSATIAVILDELAEEIAAAKKRLEGGVKLDDATLAG